MNVRTIWPYEDDFTRCLSRNLHLLGDALGMNLKLVQPEAPVGPYSLDILAKEVDKDVNVAIENQLECTDHDHLGKLLTYAAGRHAHIAIWVASEFVYEHAQALHLLNEWTRDGIDFYGVKVEAVKKAGDGRPEPRFLKVVYPGGWNKGLTLRSMEMPEHIRRYYDFFQPLVTELLGEDFADKAVQHFDYTGRFFPSRLNQDIGYAASFWKNAAWVTLHIQMEDNTLTKRIFDDLKKDQDQIQACIADEEWRWYRYDTVSFSSINVRRGGCSIDDPPEKLVKTRKWMLEYLPRLKEVFDPRVAEILSESPVRDDG